MNHSDFSIGKTFWCGGNLWRCTDIGTRVIVAMRIDSVEVGSDTPRLRQTLDQEQAEAEGWFKGPPYAVAENVFDEYAIEGCSSEQPSPNDAELSGALPDGRDQARALRAQAREGGLRFDAFLPSSLADWLLGLVERGVFSDPSEAVFVIMGEHQELEPHQDLRDELMRRGDQEAIDDPRPGILAEEFAARIKQWSAQPRPTPAQWSKARI